MSLRIPLARLARLYQPLAKQGCSTTLSQLLAKLKGPRPLSALSALGKAKALCSAKSQAFGEVKALSSAKPSAYRAKAPAISANALGDTKITSGEANALSGTKFTAFKAKLASCEAISIKAEAFKAQATNKTSAFCGTNVTFDEASTPSRQ